MQCVLGAKPLGKEEVLSAEFPHATTQLVEKEVQGPTSQQAWSQRHEGQLASRAEATLLQYPSRSCRRTGRSPLKLPILTIFKCTDSGLSAFTFLCNQLREEFLS